MKRWLERIDEGDNRKMKKLGIIAAIILIVTLAPGLILNLWGVLFSVTVMIIPTVIIGLPLFLLILIIWKLL